MLTIHTCIVWLPSSHCPNSITPQQPEARNMFTNNIRPPFWIACSRNHVSGPTLGPGSLHFPRLLLRWLEPTHLPRLSHLQEFNSVCIGLTFAAVNVLKKITRKKTKTTTTQISLAGVWCTSHKCSLTPSPRRLGAIWKSDYEVKVSAHPTPQGNTSWWIRGDYPHK